MRVTYYALVYPGKEMLTVDVPDLPCCVTEGRTIEECQTMAADAIRCCLADDIADGKPVPPKTEWPDILKKADPEMGVVVTVLPIEVIFPDSERKAPRRLSISLADSVCETIDSYLVQAGGTRSGLLATAVMEYIARQRSGAITPDSRPHKGRPISAHQKAG